MYVNLAWNIANPRALVCEDSKLAAQHILDPRLEELTLFAARTMLHKRNGGNIPVLQPNRIGTCA
jgi:hypothetical protein